MLVAAPLALSACTNYDGASYAREACGDLSALTQLGSPRQDQVEDYVGRATARAHRAAAKDGAFRDFYSDLEQVDYSVRHPASGADGKGEASLAKVVDACQGMKAPIEPPAGSASGPDWQSLTGS